MKNAERPCRAACLWKWDVNANRWVMVDSFGMDEYDYPIGAKHDYSGGNRCPWMAWVSQRIFMSKDDYYWESLPGTAVTLWSLEGGISLAVLNPPETATWMSPFFSEKLAKLQDWHGLLQGGDELYLGTVRAIEKIIFREDEK